MIHVYPLNDEKEHFLEGTTCWCEPQLELDQPEIIVIHNSVDGRELIEQAEENLKSMTTPQPRADV